MANGKQCIVLAVSTTGANAGGELLAYAAAIGARPVARRDERRTRADLVTYPPDVFEIAAFRIVGGHLHRARAWHEGTFVAASHRDEELRGRSQLGGEQLWRGVSEINLVSCITVTTSGCTCVSRVPAEIARAFVRSAI